MHIIGLLLGALATLGVILWRLHMAAEAAKGARRVSRGRPRRSPPLPLAAKGFR